MCGIVGYYGKIIGGALDAAGNLLSHRGPDDNGLFLDSHAHVGLAHARLSIIDLSPLGHQPMASASGRYTIVFNGEIYNYRELQAQLVAQGAVFKGHSDTEVLLALFERQGIEMLPMLNGIFAIAIYDQVERSLFLAVDRAGVKPLYYADRRPGFCFASEIKALLPLLDSAPELNPHCLLRTLGFLWSPGGETPLRGVRRLGPGEALLVKQQTIARHWRWGPPAFGAGTREMSDADAIAAVTKGLRTAVHRQLVADVPVGAFLSGGLDSSAIVAFAKEQSPAIDCFTIDTGPQQDDGVTADLPHARRVAKHLGVRLHEIRVEAKHLAQSLERMIVQLDEPLADPAPLHVLSIAQLARENGYKVLLSGAGGDDLFTGYRRHQALALERWWSWLPAFVRGGMREAGQAAMALSPKARRIAKAFSYAHLPANERLASYFLWADPARVHGLFAPELQMQMANVTMTAPMLEYLEQLPNDLAPLDRMLALEQRFFLPDHNLLYTDKMSMAVGVETRVPFLDNDLVDLANTLPLSIKQRGATGKWVLRKAMEPYLPQEVIYRPKTGFGAPLRRWLRHDLREWIGDMLSPETLNRRGLFNPTAVSRLIADDQSGRIDAAYTILGLACIEVWCRHFIDRKA